MQIFLVLVFVIFKDHPNIYSKGVSTTIKKYFLLAETQTSDPLTLVKILIKVGQAIDIIALDCSMPETLICFIVTELMCKKIKNTINKLKRVHEQYSRIASQFYLKNTSVLLILYTTVKISIFLFFATPFLKNSYCLFIILKKPGFNKSKLIFFRQNYSTTYMEMLQSLSGHVK